jgi:hypothetical protein
MIDQGQLALATRRRHLRCYRSSSSSPQKVQPSGPVHLTAELTGVGQRKSLDSYRSRASILR